MTFVLHLYEAGDENGITVGSVDLTDAAIDARFTDVLHGAGSMKLVLPRHHTSAALLQRDRYGRLETNAGIIDTNGWFLESGKIGLSSKDEKGGELVTWEGKGSLSILDRGVMDNDSNIAGGMDPIVGFWDLSAQGNMAGASNGHPIPMMKRALVEVELNPPNAIALVDHSSFTYALDSDGSAVPFLDGVFGVNVGNSLYQLAGRLDELGGCFQRMSDTFVYEMLLTLGTDLTGAFGAGTVRFEKGVNIAVELERRISANVRRTHLVVSGANSTYLTIANPTYTPGDMIRWGNLSVPETDDPGQLTATALNHFAARERASDAYVLPMPAHGDDPANGIYEPNVHFRVGDSVTGHTGTGSHDLNESSQVVAAITWRTKDGEDYVYDVELGYDFHWEEGPGAFAGGSAATTWLPHKRYDDFSRANLAFPNGGGAPFPITTTPANCGMGIARSGRAWAIYDGNSDSQVTMSGYKALLENGAALNEMVAYVEDPKGVWLSDDNDGGSTSTTEVMHFLFHARFEIFAIESGTGVQVVKFFIGAVPQHRVTLTIDDSVGEIATDGGSTVVKNDWVVGSYDVLWEYSPDVYARVKVWPTGTDPAPEAWTLLDTLGTASDPMEDKQFGFAFAGDGGATLRLDFIDIIHGEFAHGLATDATDMAAALAAATSFTSQNKWSLE